MAHMSKRTLDLIDRETMGGWYNFKTGRYDYDAPATDEKASEYIPQDVVSQTLYSCYRETGKSILESIIAVLLAVTKS
jgi:hypothetical protein